MFDVKPWMEELAGRLKDAFGPRLLFVGLQGSFGRGEAGPDSDIDVVTVLDGLTVDDLNEYRSVVCTMSESERACGFICGAEDLKGWPRYDLVQLERDITPVYGSIAGLIPSCGRDDLEEAVRIGASTLYHALCHSYLYGRGLGRLDQRCKEAFFVLRALHELRCGEYVHRKAELACRLAGDEQLILEYGMGLKGGLPQKTMMGMLLRWVQSVLAEVQAMKENIT